jgi:hypothetical protein
VRRFIEVSSVRVEVPPSVRAGAAALQPRSLPPGQCAGELAPSTRRGRERSAHPSPRRVARVGDTIENLTNKNDSSLGHVYGVALYGDPRFSKDDHATARGNYSPEHWGLLGERGNYSTKINNRLGDWCRLKDAICQGFNAGDTEHHEYRNYEGGLFLQQGAEMMFSHIGW